MKQRAYASTCNNIVPFVASACTLVAFLCNLLSFATNDWYCRTVLYWDKENQVKIVEDTFGLWVHCIYYKNNQSTNHCIAYPASTTADYDELQAARTCSGIGLILVMFALITMLFYSFLPSLRIRIKHLIAKGVAVATFFAGVFAMCATMIFLFWIHDNFDDKKSKFPVYNGVSVDFEMCSMIQTSVIGIVGCFIASGLALYILCTPSTALPWAFSFIESVYPADDKGENDNGDKDDKGEGQQPAVSRGSSSSAQPTQGQADAVPMQPQLTLGQEANYSAQPALAPSSLGRLQPHPPVGENANQSA